MRCAKGTWLGSVATGTSPRRGRRRTHPRAAESRCTLPNRRFAFARVFAAVGHRVGSRAGAVAVQACVVCFAVFGFVPVLFSIKAPVLTRHRGWKPQPYALVS